MRCHRRSVSAVALLALGSTTAAQTLQSSPCPLLGLNYPKPSNLASSAPLASAAAQARSQLQTALSSGSVFGNLDSQNTTFSVDVYSLHNDSSLFTQHFTPQLLASQRTQGVAAVDSDTIYRIGSVSKLWTTYIYLIAAGDQSWSQSITKFVPELEALSKQRNASANSVDNVDWTSITVGALASHLAGIGRDAAFSTDLMSVFEGLGFPNQGGFNHSTCAAGTLMLPCNRSQFFQDFTTQHPTSLPFTTTSYSNAGIQILSYALENITNTSMSDLFQKFLVSPLNLKGTSFTVPSSMNGSIIPINATASGWNADARDETPVGGYFSTINDMRTIGKAMLSSRQLSSVQTRRWMKPHSFTSDPDYAVGAPWEILRAPGGSADTPVSWIYSKSGDLGAYAAVTALMPDLDVGFSVLGAGANAVNTVRIVSDIMSATFTPALWTQAKNEAAAMFGGTYSDAATASMLTLVAPKNGTGLQVSQWTIQGQDAVAFLGSLVGGNVTITIYPVGMSSQAGNGSTVHAWRATFDVAQPLDPGAFSSNCQNWFLVDQFAYGGVGLDEFLFTVDPTGKVVQGLESRVLTVDMLKGGSTKMARRRRLLKKY